MQILRDFWFPMLLALAGTLAGIPAYLAEGNPRRVLWTIVLTLYFAAVLSYIWGDPVRGPFAKLLHPKAGDTFWLHAGVAVGFPVNQLKDGIDFSRAINIPGQPLQLWVSKTWWTSWRYKVRAMGPNQVPAIEFTNDSIQTVPIGWQLNADDQAVEVIDQNLLPQLQVIQASDYDVYLNMVLHNANQAIVLKDNRLELKPLNALTRNDFPDRIFKYPTYAHRGERQ